MRDVTGIEFRTDMTELTDLLKKHKVKFLIRKHPAVEMEPEVKDLIGFYPTGDWQVIIDSPLEGIKFSVIRGMASFGQFEIMAIPAKEKGVLKGKLKFIDPERFETAKELISKILEKGE